MANNINDGRDSASNLTIKSFNVNSIGRNPKRQDIFKFLNKKNADIQIIIDTHFSKEIEHLVKEEWGSRVYFSSFSSQSRGVAIFFKKDICVDVLKEKNDDSGNILSLLIEFDGKTILLSALYGPN